MNRELLKKYSPFPKIDINDRKWPDNVITKSPIWCSVDLRDGNQALITPMTLSEKIDFFNLLVKIGFKEIEVGFPSAAKVEFDFLRTLVERNLIPDDVKIQVLVQAREHLIEKTFEALKGVKNPILHIYNSTSVNQRKIVFKKDKKEIIDIALNGIRWVKEYSKKTNTKVELEYSPESFTGTELQFALDICNTVVDEWNPKDDEKVIINLPATIETSTPNIYADMIEWMGRNLKRRKNILISLHTHNDRGSSVAATELALLAGADRVEGTLFGNGERTGNSDILVLALNMYSQGIDPKLDFHNINHIVESVERFNKIPIHPRHPYAGSLVYTAFSGSHQDAIKKGMEYQKQKKDNELWEVPYLPIDPADIGRTYEGIIRINSQSGKGGIAYILERYYGYQLPKEMHHEIGKIIQTIVDKTGKEISNEEIFDAFNNEYLKIDTPILFVSFNITESKDDKLKSILTIKYNGEEKILEGVGNGPIDACKEALSKLSGLPKFNINGYYEHALSSGSTSKAIAYIEVENCADYSTCFGVGIDPNIIQAAVKSLIGGVNRLIKSQ